MFEFETFSPCTISEITLYTEILTAHIPCACSHLGKDNNKDNNHPCKNGYVHKQILRGQILCVC